MNTVKTLVTPFTIASFIIMAITGVLLFFHLDVGLNKVAHEWLGWLFLAAVGLHIFFVHSKSLKSYFKRPAALVVIVSAVVVTALSFLPIGDDKGKPSFIKAEQALFTGDLNLVSQILGGSESSLRESLESQGLVYRSGDNSLQAIAVQNGISQKEMMSRVFSEMN